MELRYFKMFLTIATIIILFLASFIGVMRFAYNMIFIEMYIIDALFVTGFLLFSIGLWKALGVGQLFDGFRYGYKMFKKGFAFINNNQDNDQDNSYLAFKKKRSEQETNVYWIAVLITGLLIAVLSMVI